MSNGEYHYFLSTGLPSVGYTIAIVLLETLKKPDYISTNELPLNPQKSRIEANEESNTGRSFHGFSEGKLKEAGNLTGK